MRGLFSLFLILLMTPSAFHAAGVVASPRQSEQLQVGATQLPMWKNNNRTGTTRGAVLLVLGAGSAGAWPHSLANLTDTLPDHGWHTVAIRADLELPDFSGFSARVNAGLNALPEVPGKPVVLVAADNLAQRVAQQQLEKTFSKQPSAFVFLNRPVSDLASEQQFHQQQVAVLELHNGLAAQRDLWRDRRNLAAEYQQSFYQQSRLPPSGPNWGNAPDRLSKKIAGWLKRSYN